MQSNGSGGQCASTPTPRGMPSKYEDQLREVGPEPSTPGFDQEEIGESPLSPGEDVAPEEKPDEPPERPSTLEGIIGDDDRLPVENPRIVPYRKICSLYIEFPNGRAEIGTGFFVSHHVLITAGHCVYNWQAGGWASRIRVRPGSGAGNTTPYGEYWAKNLHTTPEWFNARADGEAEAEDYGAIVLGEAVGKKVGTFGYGALSDSELEQLKVHGAGYPVDSPHHSIYSKGNIKNVLPHRVFYDMDTLGGNSGMPVWRFLDDKRTVVGIHNYYKPEHTANAGTRITETVYQWFNYWVQQGA